ncbi:2-iminoacetate synthase ThiH [Alginatibacterium sediminis]|uniref:2-iminoacetate synthase ThiH n=1 Tax=Alginatibacterium sediminis TaxID=2164068 RepID=A0A420E6S6_9ALTE|nr:2-iminoacetate synthase ThiH [Alginatibacterium sediminis]RKF14327.1 2-iminoacetate synthase ThiH [Alginatibacterium sediminis]
MAIAKSFEQELANMDWDHQRMQLFGVNASSVEAAIAKAQRGQRLALHDFQALISPAAADYLETMAQLSQQITQQRFGKTQQLYIPLYLSNLCSNICSYCGFSMENKIRRKTLDMSELEDELLAIKDWGFEHILLVTGESERRVGMDYFRQVLPKVKQHFSHLSMEVQPLEKKEYQELQSLGLDAVLVYQETYHRAHYAQVHVKGKKSDFNYRLDTAERLGEVGMKKIGLGVLLGLSDWRVDSYYLAMHLQYLQKRYWRSKFSISFPRLRPCETGFQPRSLIDERQLLQLICAYRLFQPDVDISLSTRESAHFRDNVIALGVTTMSAFSSTQPGGYAQNSQQSLEQFSIDDNRTPNQVVAAIQKAGYQAVWKDWDSHL